MENLLTPPELPPPPQPPKRRWERPFYLIFAALISILSALLLYAVAIWFGNVNQDEGWYLYASRLVAEGKMPYRDFFFTQGPVLPYCYGWLKGLWSAHGLLGGRILTAFFGFLSCALTAWLARRAVPKRAAPETAIMAFALTAGNLYHAYFTSLPKTYAISAFFLMAGFGCLTLCTRTSAAKHSLFRAMWAIPAGMLIALAAGARLSLGLVLPITAIALLFTWRRTGAAFFWFGIGGAAGLLLVYGAPIEQAKEAFLFSQTFHVERGGRDLFLMGGSCSRIVRAYLPLALLFVFLTLFRLLFPSACRGSLAETADDTESETASSDRGTFWPWIWFFSAGGVFLLHLTSPHPYDDYQVPIMGLFAAAGAAWLGQLVGNGAVRSRLCLFWVCAALLASFGSPLIQTWFTHGLDRFWVISKKMPDLVQMREAAQEIRNLTEKDETLLTQDLYLAVEAGMKVPHGLEMGPFSYFPNLTDEQAARYHVLNRAGLLALLHTAPCQVAAYSGYGWAIQSPVMDRVPDSDRQRFLTLLGQHYDYVSEIPDFGQNRTTLLLLSRRKPIAPQDANP